MRGVGTSGRKGFCRGFRGEERAGLGIFVADFGAIGGEGKSGSRGFCG